MSDNGLDASIVITTYRREDMLAELLDALRHQVLNRSVEVIIVDNCPSTGARAVVEGHDDPALFYLHEPRSGVVYARNRGAAAARGTYVIFLDDDEVPGAGWLDAWLHQADGVTDMSFGRIVPRLLSPCPDDIIEQVNRNFSRDMGRATGGDISSYWAHLGTGNAMFHKSRCLGENDPFDLRFNASGGEDVWLIRKLVKQGRRLIWNDSAVVEELVPQDRMTLSYLKVRRFNQGRLRCILMFGEGGLAGGARVLVWMGLGAIQFIVSQTAATLASALVPRRVPNLLCSASAGAGKLLWWRQTRSRSYGNG